MTDLPQQPISDAPNPQPAGQTSVQNSQPVSYSGGNKEIGGPAIGTELPLHGVGQEIVLPKEVVSAGVKAQPTTVPLPPQIANMGVQSVGANVPTQPTSGNTITLPLTDAQIAQALHESVTNSVRWLAEWCTRQIKMVHGKIKKNDQ